MERQNNYRWLIEQVPIPPQKRILEKSLILKKKAETLIPSCSQTFSKNPDQFVQGVAPVFVTHGNGSRVWDIDGNEYIDYTMALGPVILGYNYPDVTKAVVEQANKGTTYSLPHPLEVELAELLVDIIPSAEMVRFGKNGADATAAAIRAARFYTQRDRIACCGYHGWQDWYVCTAADKSGGVPKALQQFTIPFEYNNIESLKKIFSEYPRQIAAVILEPTNVVKPKDGFLEEVRDLAHKEGALLIFDEVITGFRLALGGTQEFFRVTPDLSCFSKAMSNGYPISAVVGRRDIMKLFDKDIFFSVTLGGETVSIAAALATIKTIRKNNVIDYIWRQGKELQDGYNQLAKAYNLEKYTCCIGYPPHTIIDFKNIEDNSSLLIKSFFQQECLKRGILFTGLQNVSFSHSDEDINYTLYVYRTVLEMLVKIINTGDINKYMEGAPIQPLLRR